MLVATRPPPHHLTPIQTSSSSVTNLSEAGVCMGQRAGLCVFRSTRTFCKMLAISRILTAPLKGGLYNVL